jgi:hypothetical protein
MSDYFMKDEKVATKKLDEDMDEYWAKKKAASDEAAAAAAEPAAEEGES